MREIKFRIWNIRERRYIQEFDMLVIDFNGIIYESLIYDGLYEVEQEDYILEQYTGLKDKKGVEIYEGDIVEHKYYGEITQGKVYFDDYCWNITDFSEPTYDCPSLVFSEEMIFTVIGNIHEEEL